MSAHNTAITQDCTCSIDLQTKQDGDVWKVTLNNRSIGKKTVRSVSLLCPDGFCVGGENVWVQSETMCGITGLQPAADGLRSYGVMGFPATGETPARLIGALDLRTVAAWIHLCQTVRGLEPKIVFELDGIEWMPKENRYLSDLVILEGESLSDLFEQYGKMSGCVMNARIPKEPTCGWCSWYYYYGHETETDILNNAHELKESGVLPAGAVIQIDDGWNLPEENALRNWGDWMPGRKFPRGMKAVAADLHALGFKAGLWLAPFSADAAGELAKAYPEWLLNTEEKGLLDEGGNLVYGLDLTNPDVLKFIDETFERVFNEWNFDYVKLDFLMHAMADGSRFDGSRTKAEAMHHALMRIRRIAGDRFILCCGSPLGPAVGAADAMRIGFDVGSRWHAPMWSDIWPNGNCSVKPAAYSSVYCQWMNGQWWLNDPDCLVVRKQSSRFEPLEFNETHPGGSVSAEAFGLNDEEAGCWARMVYVVGTFHILSEVWNELPMCRKDLIRKVLSSRVSRFRMVDTGSETVMMMHSKASRSFAVFNLSDETVVPELPSEWKPGIYTEAFSDEKIQIREDKKIPDMPPHSGRIWQYQEVDGI